MDRRGKRGGRPADGVLFPKFYLKPPNIGTAKAGTLKGRELSLQEVNSNPWKFQYIG